LIFSLYLFCYFTGFGVANCYSLDTKSNKNVKKEKIYSTFISGIMFSNGLDECFAFLSFALISCSTTVTSSAVLCMIVLFIRHCEALLLICVWQSRGNLMNEKHNYEIAIPIFIGTSCAGLRTTCPALQENLYAPCFDVQCVAIGSLNTSYRLDFFICIRSTDIRIAANCLFFAESRILRRAGEPPHSCASMGYYQSQKLYSSVKLIHVISIF
jgi:hypothetical protein